MYKEDFIDSAYFQHKDVKFIFGIDSKNHLIDDRSGLMLFEYIDSGEGFYTIDFKRIKYKKDDAVFIKPWQHVSITPTSPTKRIFLAYTPHIDDGISKYMENDQVRKKANCKEPLFNLFEFLQDKEMCIDSITFLFLNSISDCIE